MDEDKIEEHSEWIRETTGHHIRVKTIESYTVTYYYLDSPEETFTRPKWDFLARFHKLNAFSGH